jgi:NADH-quinone oxidoreductase subunit J
MNLLILIAVLILALASITLKKTVPAMIAFASMMFLLGIYYFLLDEKLLGLLQIFVYTGGIVVLMLFGITVIGETFPEAKARPWAILSSILVGGSLIYLVTMLLANTPMLTEQSSNQALAFTERYADFVLIFALIGVSLLYGTMKMVKFLRGKHYD